MIFELIAVLVVMVFLFNKLNNKIVDLNDDIAKLQAELRQHKDDLKSSNSSDSATDTTLLSSLSNTAVAKSITPPPLPTTVNADISHDNNDIFYDIVQPNEVADPSQALDYSINSDADIAKKPTDISKKTNSAVEPDEHSLPIVTSLFHSIKNWFLVGNLVVRVGVLVLLVGVVLLLRLLSDYIEVSIESKLIAIGVIGLGLAGLGLKLAKNRFAYGISLQGAGLAIAYLTTFFAYSVYQVLPSLPSFIGLGVLSAITIGLAVRQNAFPLALLALSGGFFAPILTADDTGSLTTLFCYYLLLNVTIAIIAHYRPWKVLNLFGVIVTFGLAYYWGISETLTTTIESQRWSLVLLVALHLALYLFVVVRYAQQIIAYNTANETVATLPTKNAASIQPASSLYLFPIDTGLLFSVPLLAFGLLSALLNDIANALTFTSAILAAVYLGLGWLLVQRSSRYALITEGMLALGFGFLALVIPLALDAEWIAFGWSVQGLALVWFGRRSLRAWSVLFGLLLQLISIVMLMVTLFFSYKNYPTLALSVSALAFLASVFTLRANNSPALYHLTGSENTNLQTEQKSDIKTDIKTRDSISTYAKDLGISETAAYQWFNSIDEKGSAFSIIWRSPAFISFLTFIAVVWALYVGMADFEQWLDSQRIATTTLIALASLLSVSIYWLINRYRPWSEIRQLSQGLLVIFYVALILQLPQKFEFNIPWNSGNWTLFAVLVMGWLLFAPLWLRTWYNNHQLSRFDNASWLATGVLVLAAAVHYGLPDSQGVMTILIPVALMLAGLYLSYRHNKFLSNNPRNYNNKQGLVYWFDGQAALTDCAKVFVPIALLWVFVSNWSYDGLIWHLPYLPLINLYDMSLWLVVIYGLSAIYFSQQNYITAATLRVGDANNKTFNPQPMLIILGLISFWVISSMLVRTLHAFIGTPLWNQYPLGAWNSEQVQTGLTILWTLIALVATIIASRNLKRTPWFMGIGLLGIVVLKLVLVDLSQTEAIWRVVSFLVAGSLILLIGYLAPLPPEHIEKVAEDKV